MNRLLQKRYKPENVSETVNYRFVSAAQRNALLGATTGLKHRSPCSLRKSVPYLPDDELVSPAAHLVQENAVEVGVVVQALVGLGDCVQESSVHPPVHWHLRLNKGHIVCDGIYTVREERMRQNM